MFKLDSGNILEYDSDCIFIAHPDKQTLSYTFKSEIMISSPSDKLFIYSNNLSKIVINMLTTDISIETKKINLKTFEISNVVYKDKIEYPHSLIIMLINKKKIQTKNYMIQNLLEAIKNKKGIGATDVAIKRIALFGSYDKKIIGLFNVYNICNDKKRHHICNINDTFFNF